MLRMDSIGRGQVRSGRTGGTAGSGFTFVDGVFVLIYFFFSKGIGEGSHQSVVSPRTRHDRDTCDLVVSESVKCRPSFGRTIVPCYAFASVRAIAADNFCRTTEPGPNVRFGNVIFRPCLDGDYSTDMPCQTVAHAAGFVMSIRIADKQRVTLSVDGSRLSGVAYRFCACLLCRP